MRILLLENPARPIPENARADFERLLASHAVERREVPQKRPRRKPVFEADLIIAAGGDGTVLAAAHYARGRGVPILGFNVGHVGFLAGITLDDFRTELPHLLEGRWRIEARTSLRVELPNNRSGWALNETSLQIAGPGIFAASVCFGTQHVSDFRGDGLVVSTSTGSTAYNFLLGGPLLAPGSSLISITPKNPLPSAFSVVPEHPPTLPASKVQRFGFTCSIARDAAPYSSETSKTPRSRADCGPCSTAWPKPERSGRTR